jgi:hypothetical protein
MAQEDLAVASILLVAAKPDRRATSRTDASLTSS